MTMFPHSDTDPATASDREADAPLQAAGAPIDWDALRMRLFADRALLGLAAQDETQAFRPVRLRLCGSFDTDAASAMNTYGKFSMSVNRSVSTNVKTADGTTLPDAGKATIGDRGR